MIILGDSSQLYMHDQASKGAVTFHVRRRPSEGGAGPRRRKKKSAERDGPRWWLIHYLWSKLEKYIHIFTIICISISFIREGLPFLVELTPEGGENRVARLQLSVTEVSFVLTSSLSTFFLYFCICYFVFSCPSSSIPTLVTYLLTYWLTESWC